ncbi:molybdenum cofactor biosynthesis prote [Gloeophyllum trabeum ATCC 11539]|uniref:Molybdenum cofactor biosynthesis prote n=1 Tax=Gloeophyllum trabeum (strain ATCC 11539 / FP-39264 / Madison 617) TaxID=670483 RepID=S7QKH0_GLOTA|nr:molybdenum cofactor biosynthesis prote [Gloeophyllum trabeum ATCC 11539]EPQ60256.1 molybdenum cofactor biosynthesis prote [Gloeophyllum trabeum ATCC 11539]
MMSRIRAPKLHRQFQTFTRREHAQPVSLLSSVQAKIAQIDAEKPFSPALIDSFQRRHDYLRISLTEKCNLRCFYCMPSEGVDLSPKSHILTDDEVIRLAELFVKSGVRKIRLTGGEPTVRKGIVDLIGRLNELRKYGLQSIGMTSNGIALHRRIPQLVENGLTHLNLSLDTLDPFKFEIMTRRPGHDAVLRSLRVALESPGLHSVKLNVVVIKDLNDYEVPEFVEMTKDNNLSVRFIEFMPFTGNKWQQTKMVPSSELLDRISSRHPELFKAADELNDTARSYKIPGYAGSFGFISSMSDHFCGSCNRLRLTADGQIKVCLFDNKEVSLRDRIRQGTSDSELLEVIGQAVRGKAEKHGGMKDLDDLKEGPNRPMILIGGFSARNIIKMFHRRIYHWLRDTSVLKLQRRVYSSNSHGPFPRLTHVDKMGRPSMVNVSDKQPTKRSATAVGRIHIPPVAYDLLTTSYPGETGEDDLTDPLSKAKTKARSKGDVLTVAQLAAIMGCKKTSDLIPLCHPLALSHISVTLTPEVSQPLRSESNLTSSSETPNGNHSPRYSIACRATVNYEGKTGVEMEALTAVSVGLLTVWDMLKAVAGKEMMIGEIYVERKTGGKSGDFMKLEDGR